MWGSLGNTVGGSLGSGAGWCVRESVVGVSGSIGSGVWVVSGKA